MKLSGREKATIFLSLLGAETSARILRYLPDEMADIIAEGINHLPTPSPEALGSVLSEFESYLALPEASEDYYPRLEEPEKPKTPKRSYAVFMYERPQMVAFIAGTLPANEQNSLLQSIPRDKMIVEEMLKTMKKNAYTEKLELKLKEHFEGKKM